MLRLSHRLLTSAQQALFLDEKGSRFLVEVARKLSAAKNGDISAESTSISYWERINDEANLLREKTAEIQQLKSLVRETTDKELKALATEDVEAADAQADEAASRLAAVIVPTTEMDVLRKCQIELTAGAGGQEAMLFTGELLEMYRRYSEWRGWKWTPFQIENVALGGVRSAAVAVEGEGVYAALRFEAGVHRVQRIPLTDKSRMHTSTSSVAVLPEPDEVEVLLPPGSVKIEAMRASGPGGQNVNKRSSAVRLTHKDSGIAVHCMEERFQHLNLQIAFKRLAAILMQQKVDSSSEKVMSARKLQVGSKARAEKIRTYNFKDDRITDHRLHLHMTNIEELMHGSDHLHSLIERLSQFDKEERLKMIIDDCILE